MADKRVQCTASLLMILALSASPGLAAPPTGAAQIHIPHTTACNFSAWAPFRAREPIPVRAAPARTAKILGELPNMPLTDEDASAIEFDVVEARPGWLKIDHASDPVELDDKGEPIPSRMLPQGAGWIRADGAQIGIQSALGYARPDAASPLILDIGDDWLTDMGRIDAIRGCSGEWLLVDYHIERARGPSDALIEIPEDRRPKGTAWFRGICANQKTTCDMASVDRRK